MEPNNPTIQQSRNPTIHHSIAMGQVVDTESAKEFMREALEKVAADELLKICGEVELKSQWFQ